MAELIVLTVATLVLVGGVAVHLIDTFWARRLVTRKRVLVSLRSGSAVEGVLWKRRGRVVVLKSAQLHEPGSAPASMDGDVVVDRDQVEYTQVVG